MLWGKVKVKKVLNDAGVILFCNTIFPQPLLKDKRGRSVKFLGTQALCPVHQPKLSPGLAARPVKGAGFPHAPSAGD